MCMRKTKIICTLGPAADSDEVVRELMLAGMNVARLNFSHGSYEEHQQRIDRVKGSARSLIFRLHFFSIQKDRRSEPGSLKAERPISSRVPRS